MVIYVPAPGVTWSVAQQEAVDQNFDAMVALKFALCRARRHGLLTKTKSSKWLNGNAFLVVRSLHASQTIETSAFPRIMDGSFGEALAAYATRRQLVGTAVYQHTFAEANIAWDAKLSVGNEFCDSDSGPCGG